MSTACPVLLGWQVITPKKGGAVGYTKKTEAWCRLRKTKTRYDKDIAHKTSVTSRLSPTQRNKRKLLVDSRVAINLRGYGKAREMGVHPIRKQKATRQRDPKSFSYTQREVQRTRRGQNFFVSPLESVVMGYVVIRFIQKIPKPEQPLHLQVTPLCS